MSEIRYPGITVQLTGTDGNTLMLAGLIRSALRRAGVPVEDRDTFTREVMESASYGEALLVMQRWVAVT